MDMPTEQVIVAAGAVLSVGLYSIAYLQVRRRFPERATEYLVVALTTAAGATVSASVAATGR